MSLPDSDSSTPPRAPAADPFDPPIADPYDLDELSREPVEPDYSDVPIVMPLEPVAEPIEEDAPVVDLVDVECWRCGWYDVPDYGRCARCDARLHRRRRRPRSPGTGGPSRLGVVLISYGLLVLTCMVWGLMLVGSGKNFTEEQTKTGLAVMEAIDTVLVLFTVLLVGRVTFRDAPPGSAPAAWALAGPVLLVLIAGNVLFSAVLREVFRVPAVPGPPVTLAAVLLICVQPALVEELFFRHVALGALRREMSLRIAILVTSVMFAVAHLHNPLGMPYLFVAGVAFGYARVYGGLSLSMLMHFLHNLAVISIDSMN